MKTFAQQIKQQIKKTTINILWPILKSRPDLLILGAQKAGTTSLYSYLTQHPQIIKNKYTKEINFFNSHKNYANGFGYYLHHFPSKLIKRNRLTLEASPSYLCEDHTPELIKKHLEKVKMIVLLREPSQRTYSAWKMFHHWGETRKRLSEYIDHRSFSESINHELSGIHREGEKNYRYIETSLYAQQLENYFKYFPRESFLILDYRDLSNDLTGILNSTCDFLNIERFSQKQLKGMQGEIHNLGVKTQITSEEQKTLDMLKEYYKPHNQRLYQLLNHDYQW